MKQEIWKPVANWENVYEVSNLGRIRSLDRVLVNGQRFKGRILKPTSNGHGYMSIALYHHRTSTRVYVHRLVVGAFIAPIPDGLEVNHKNGLPGDNRVENLEIVTSAQNKRHALDTGLRRPVRGEAVGKARLAEVNIPHIFELRAEGMPLKEIGDLFGVNHATVRMVLFRETWSHVYVDPELVERAQAVTGRKGEQNNGSKLTEADVFEVYRLSKEGYLQREIAEMFGVTPGAIGNILRGRNWPHLYHHFEDEDIIPEEKVYEREEI